VRFLSFAGALAALGLVAAAPANLATTPISRLSTPWWQQRFEAKQREIAAGPYDLVWLGDSITQNFEKQGGHGWDDYRPVWDRFYGGLHALNLGFKGDSTCHVIWRLEHGELDFTTPPRLIVLLIGANNFGHVHTDANQTYDGIVRIVDMIHARLPRTRVLVVGTLPSIRSAWVDTNTHALNHRLAAELRTGRPWITYRDVGDVLLHDGRPDPARYLDGHLTPPDPPLHPSAQSQAEIARRLQPDIAKLLQGAAD